MSDMKCPFCQQGLRPVSNFDNQDKRCVWYCPNCATNERVWVMANERVWQELIRTRKVLDESMEHITGLNTMIESWLNLINSDLDQETKLHILKSAISAYVENKGDDNE